MPRYYFNLAQAKDESGTELANIVEAKCEALRYASKLLCDSANEFWTTPEFTMIVTDESELVLFSLVLVGTDAPVIRHIT